MREGVGLAVTVAKRVRVWIGAGLVAGLVAALGPFVLGALPSGPAVAAQTPSTARALPEFVAIAAGPLTMGADPARDPQAFDNERWSAAQGEGTLDVPLFYLSRTEVTVAAFSAFAAATGAKPDARALDAPAAHPVAFVSWPDALAYCRWLEATLKASPATAPEIAQRLARRMARDAAHRSAVGEGGPRRRPAAVIRGATRPGATVRTTKARHPYPPGSSRVLSARTVSPTWPETCGSGRAVRISPIPTTRPTIARASKPTRSG